MAVARAGVSAGPPRGSPGAPSAPGDGAAGGAAGRGRGTGDTPAGGGWPRTYPAGSSRASAPARRLMPPAARGPQRRLRRRAAGAAGVRAPACPSAALGKGRRAPPQPRAEGKPPRSGLWAPAPLRLLPVSERAGLAGRGWPWWSRGFCQKPFGGGSRPEPARGTRKPAAAPPGPGLARAVPGAGAPPRVLPRRGWSCRCGPGGSRRAGRETQRNGSNLAKSRVGRRALRAPARHGRGLAGGEARSSAQGTRGTRSPQSPRASPRTDTQLLLHTPDRWPRFLLLDASTDDELTILQGSQSVRPPATPGQARDLIHLSGTTPRWAQRVKASQLGNIQYAQQLPWEREASMLSAWTLKNALKAFHSEQNWTL